MKRRRRIRPQWNWATTLSLQYTDDAAGANPLYISGPLLPAARVEWLLENGRGRDHLTVMGILLWLDFLWEAPGSGAAASMQDVDFWVMKYQDTSATGAADLVLPYAPYASPILPSALTSWNLPSADESDGLDPFLWTHHLSQYVAGTQCPAVGYTAGDFFIPIQETATNTGYSLPAGGTVQPNVNVRAAWQPDVHIKTRRNLKRGEGIAIGYNLGLGLGNNITYSLSVRARVLTS